MKTRFNNAKLGEYGETSKSISLRIVAKFAACAVLAFGLTASALASCGDSLAAMASGKAVVSSIGKQLANAPANGSNNSSIVGFWYVQFVAGGETIQEAYQNWNLGGTEVHNPNVDPRTGNVCLGTWVPISGGGFKLAHRVWNYDNAGDFLGTIHLSETVYLSHNGTQQTGTFKLDFYDPSGNFLMEIAGNITGQRIQVE